MGRVLPELHLEDAVTLGRYLTPHHVKQELGPSGARVKQVLEARLLSSQDNLD